MVKLELLLYQQVKYFIEENKKVNINYDNFNLSRIIISPNMLAQLDSIAVGYELFEKRTPTTSTICGQKNCKMPPPHIVLKTQQLFKIFKFLQLTNSSHFKHFWLFGPVCRFFWNDQNLNFLNIFGFLAYSAPHSFCACCQCCIE